MSSRPGAGVARERGPGRRDLLARASVLTGLGTLLSRFTGLIRLIVLAAVVGGGAAGDAFNLANNTPNIINDLVLGGILSATFVPVFIETLARNDPRSARASISAVVTLAAVVLVVATVLFEFAAPEIIRLYTFGASRSPMEQHAAVTLLRYFAPQLLGYGACGVIAAVLATRDRFAIVGIVPVVNNLVSIAVLGIFAIMERTPSLAAFAARPGLVAFLGLGTTAGILLQAAALVPSLRRAGVGLRPTWRPKDPAIRRIVSLSGWTFGFVVANQVAVFVVLALQYRGSTGSVSAYTYAYTFFQLPFGLIAASIINVATPDLARAARLRDLGLFSRRFGAALKQILAVVLPSMAVYLVLARPLITIVLQHYHETGGEADLTASVLALFALGLPGFCTYFWCVRAFQAMQDTRTAFGCYVVENGLNIVLAFALFPRFGVRGLALSYSIAYTAAALVALVVLRGRAGALGGATIGRAALRSLVLSGLTAVVLAFVVTVTGTPGGIGGAVRLLLALGVGGFVYLGGAGIASTLATRRIGRQRERPRGASRGLARRGDPGGN